MISQRRISLILISLGVLLVISVIFATGIGGSAVVRPGDVPRVIWHHLGGPMSTSDMLDMIVWQIRLPRIALALLVGASLAVAGALMQSLFHNPMADPYIVGVSSGAALGAVLAVTLGLQFAFAGFVTRSLFAFIGAVAVTGLVYFLSRRGGRVPIGTLLLTGIAIGGLMSAITSLLLMQWRPDDMRMVIMWLMGSLAGRDWAAVFSLLPYTFIGVTIAVLWRRELNIMALGDETAHHLGVNLERTRMLILVVASMLAAAAVAVSGVIAFIGLIVPHLMRLLVGPNHRQLIPACIIGGGLLLIWADVLAQVIIPGAEIPIGIVTSALGCPFFLYLLQRQRV
ncbi:MAG: iron ABC transporter permease [bacterium]